MQQKRHGGGFCSEICDVRQTGGQVSEYSKSGGAEILNPQ